MGLNAFLSSAGATYNVDRGEILPPADANLQHIGRRLEGYIGSNTGEHGKQSMRPQMEQDFEWGKEFGIEGFPLVVSASV